AGDRHRACGAGRGPGGERGRSGGRCDPRERCHRTRRGRAPHAARRVAQGAGAAVLARSRDGEAVRDGDRRRHVRPRARARRGGGVERRRTGTAVLPRRPRDDDLRGDERDPAPRPRTRAHAAMEGGVVSDDVRQLVVDGVEALARRELEPHGAAWDRDAAFPEHVFATWAEHGLLSLALPEARGGVGLPLPDRLAVLEAIARTDASVALVVATHALAMEVAAMVGRLEEVGEGEVWSVVVPRREAGCVWTPTGDGAGVLAGALGPAVLAERADAVVVFANDGPRHRVFVVRRGTWAWEDRGVRVGLAMRAARVVHSDVDAAIVPADAWGGVVDEAAVARVLAMAHLSVAAIGLGLGRAALADACRHARARVQFGQPIATFQAIGRKVADMGTTLEAAALLVDAAARHVER